MSSLLAPLRALGCVVFLVSSVVAIGCDDGGSPVGEKCNETAGSPCESDLACVTDATVPGGGTCRSVCETADDCDEGFTCSKRSGLLVDEEPVEAVCVPGAS